MRLSDLRVGQHGIVKALLSDGAMRRRLLDIGLVPGTTVSCVGRSVAGDPAAYLIRGAVIAIRDSDSVAILLKGDSSPWA